MTRKSILGVAMGLGLIGSSAALMAQKSNAAEVLLGQGLHQEEVDYNCREAIKTFQKVIAQRNVPRGIAARAQLHIGACQEQLGQREARAAYELLVARYSDQTDLVAQANARIAFLSGPATAQNAGKGQRFIPLATSSVTGGSVSADGRSIAYIDMRQPDGRTAVVVRDLRTGQTRPVSPMAAGNSGVSNVWYPVFSPDARQLAYVWAEGQEVELRVINLQEPGVPRFRRLLSDQYVQPFDWTPDGKSIVVAMNHRDKSSEVALVSVADGSRRALTKVEGEWSSMFVSPDGKYLARDHRANQADRPFDIFLLPMDGSPEVRVVDHPADDRLVGWSPDGQQLLFTSDRNTGSPSLYALAIANGRPQQTRPTLIESNIRRVGSLGVTRAGTLYYWRLRQGTDDPRIQEIEIATFDFESGAMGAPTLVGAERQANYTAPAWSKDGRYLAYHAMQTPQAPSACVICPQSVFIRSMDTGATRELHVDIPLGSLDWSPDGRYLVSAVPTTGVHLIDAQTGTSRSIATGDRRRAVWSRDGATIYYYASMGGSPRDPATGEGNAAIVARDMASGNERVLIRRANIGAPVLSPDGRSIVTVSTDAATKSRAVLLIPANGGEARVLYRVDLQPLAIVTWAADSRSVLVMKGDEREIWRLPIEGAPRKLFNDTDRRFGTGPFPLAVHPDGMRVAMVRRSVEQQPDEPGVWVLENFLPRAASATR